MTLMMVATSALTALLFHLLFFSSLAPVWRVLCCVLCVVCCVLCAVLCCAVCCVVCLELKAETEQRYQARRMIGGIDNMLFSTFCQTLNVQDSFVCR